MTNEYISWLTVMLQKSFNVKLIPNSNMLTAMFTRNLSSRF